MTKPKAADETDIVRAIIEDATRRTEQARADISKAIAGLDATIRAKVEQHEKLTLRSVNQADMAQSIAAGLRAYIAGKRAELKRNTDRFANLSEHRSITTFGSINGDGRHVKSVRTPTAFKWCDYLDDPLMVLAVLITDADIDAFAERAARESGAPETGPGIDELAAQANALATEIENLYEKRHELRGQLSHFIDISLSPMVPNSFFKPKFDSSRGPQSKPEPTKISVPLGEPVNWGTPPNAKYDAQVPERWDESVTGDPSAWRYAQMPAPRTDGPASAPAPVTPAGVPLGVLADAIKGEGAATGDLLDMDDPVA